MKQSPSDQNLEQRLRASKFSGGGFLGDDDRPFNEIIADDQRRLEATGVEKQRLVAKLRDIYAEAQQAYGGAVEIKPGVTAAYYESRGKIPSPFRGDGVFPKGEVEVQEASSGQTLHITPLGIALIEKHDFYQGKGNRYRIDPELAVRLVI